MKVKAPSTIKLKAGFVLSASKIKRYRLGKQLLKLDVLKWNDLKALAENSFNWKSKGVFDGSYVLQKYDEAFTKVARNYTKDPELSSFASKMSLYLKHPNVKALFLNEFNKIMLDKEDDNVNKEMIKIGKISAKKLTIKSTRTLIESFDAASSENPPNLPIINEESDYNAGSSSPKIHHRPNNMQESDNDIVSTSTSSKTSNVDTANVGLTYSKLKQVIYDKAKSTHQDYVNGVNISADDRKMMACGSSLILDLVDNQNVILQSLFDDTTWAKLKSHFRSRLRIEAPILPKEMMDKWTYMEGLLTKYNDYQAAQKYLALVFSKDSTSKYQQKYIKLYMSILDCIENNPLLMNHDTKKVSEVDYLTGIWVPVFKALFAINNNLIRIKTGETVPEDSTEGKATLYDDLDNIIGFKVDIRFIVDFKDFEFDLGAAEVCLPGAGNVKIVDDLAKLLREGKDNTDGIHNVLIGDDETPRSWILQLSGLSAYLSTVTYAGYDINVGILQDDIAFPSCISDFSNAKKSHDMLRALFKFRDDIEGYAHKIQAKMTSSKQLVDDTSKKFNDIGSQSPPRLQRSSAQTWFTPPRNERTRSIFTRLNADLLSSGHLEDIYAYDDDNDSSEDDGDDFGFVRTSTGWFDPASGKYFSTHPLL